MIPPIKDAASKCCGGVVGEAAVEEVEIVVNICEVVLLVVVELLCSVVEDVVELGRTVLDFVDVNRGVVLCVTVDVLPEVVSLPPSWAIVESARNKTAKPNATHPTKNVYKSLFIFTASFGFLVFPDTVFLS